MYRHDNRQYSDSRGSNFHGRRRFRGQYVRSRMPPNHEENQDEDQQEQQHMLPQNQQHSNQQNHLHQPQPRLQHRQAQQHDLEDIKDICLKLSVELDAVKTCVNQVASSLDQLKLSFQQQRQHQSAATSTAANNTTATTTATDRDIKRKKTKLLKRRGKLDQHDNLEDGAAARPDEVGTEKKRRNQRRDFKDKEKTFPPRQNDDSTTQAADPSSEDKIEGEEGTDRVKRVFRRRKQPFNRKAYYNDRRKRMDSSERNSNDTSPQNEANGDDYGRPTKSKSVPKKDYPELSETDLNELVQAMKRDFFASEISLVRKAIDEKGPVAAKEFASAILDHAICDVTSPTKLSEIANNLYQILVSGDTGIEFQAVFCSALNDISKREDDIAIDAPRYMDTLGQVLGQCLVPMNTNRNKHLMIQFINKIMQSYAQQSKALLLASIMKGISGKKDERFAKDIWDSSNLNWSDFINDGTKLDEFIESQDVKFTTQRFSPEPRKARRTPADSERFADDVTDLVEKGCTTSQLEDLVRDLELDPEEEVDYLGTLVYAIVRGCLITDSGDYKLDTEALNKYSSIMKHQHKKEEVDAIALNALTALTKLWHQYNCPQNLMSTILLALHGNGTASYDSLKTWLNSDDLKNIPGIGAARLNSKRCIEDLGAVRS